MRRGACGLRGESLRVGRTGARFGDAGFDVQCERWRRRRLRVCRLRCGYGAAAILVAAAGIAKGALIRFRSRSVTLVDAFAQAAGVIWSSRRRQRERSKSSDKREQQQKSCGQAVHFSCESEPQGSGQHSTDSRVGARVAGLTSLPNSPPFDYAPGRLSRADDAREMGHPGFDRPYGFRDGNGFPDKAWLAEPTLSLSKGVPAPHGRTIRLCR